MLLTLLEWSLVAATLSFLTEPVYQSPRVPPEYQVCENTESFTHLCTKVPTDHFDDMIVDAASIYNLNPRILALTVVRESGCDPTAVGSSGELGLVQVYPAVWSQVLEQQGLSDLSDPWTNLLSGAYILTRLHHRSESVCGTLRRYNGSGPRARAYARAQCEQYRTLFGEEPWIL